MAIAVDRSRRSRSFRVSAVAPLGVALAASSLLGFVAGHNVGDREPAAAPAPAVATGPDAATQQWLSVADLGAIAGPQAPIVTPPTPWPPEADIGPLLPR